MKTKIRGLVFVGFAAAVFAQSASAEITDSDKTVTSKTYVDSKVEATVNNATTINSGSPDDKAPSSLNVYKFVSNQIVSSGGGVDGNPDYHTDKIGYLDSTWAEDNTNLESPYMVTKAQLVANPTWQAHVVKWELIVPDARVAESAGDITAGGDSDATATEQTNLTTAKAVYDFVTYGDPNDPDNNGFQPAVDSSATSSNSFRAGWYNNGAATWATVKVRGNGTEAQDPSLGYLVMDQQVTPNGDTGSVYTISLKNDSIAGLASDISAVGGSGGTAHLIADKLTTAKAVYDYAVKKNWTSAEAGKHLVVGSDGIVTVTENVSPDLPGADDMPDECKTPNGGKVCALVAYYDTGTPLLQPEDTDYRAAGLRYEWTIMAPTGSNG